MMGLLALPGRFMEFFFQQTFVKNSPRHPHGLNTRSSEQSSDDAWVVIGGVAGCISVVVAIIGLHRSRITALTSRPENRVARPPDTPNVDVEGVGTHGYHAPEPPPVVLDLPRPHTTPFYPAVPDPQFAAPPRGLLHEPARPDPVFLRRFAPRIGSVATWPQYERPA